MVDHPAEYRWSSYRSNAQGEPSKLLTSHPLYAAFGPDDESRWAAYRALFRDQLDPGPVDEIRRATNSNYALGSPRFQAQVEAVLDRRATPRRSGRPPKKTDVPESGDLF
ncbi:MAG: hypothetical protein ABFS23_09740 [Pseudomonadota bacterium]